MPAVSVKRGEKHLLLRERERTGEIAAAGMLPRARRAQDRDGWGERGAGTCRAPPRLGRRRGDR